jgi:hypothetical protein
MLKRDNISPASEVSASEAMIFLTARVLYQTRIMDDDQFWMILSEAKNMIMQAGENIEAGLAKKQYMIAFADRRYVAWPGMDGWFDIETGSPMIEGIEPAVETTSYNLNTIAARGAEVFHRASKLFEQNQCAMEGTDDISQKATQ